MMLGREQEGRERAEAGTKRYRKLGCNHLEHVPKFSAGLPSRWHDTHFPGIHAP